MEESQHTLGGAATLPGRLLRAEDGDGQQREDGQALPPCLRSWSVLLFRWAGQDKEEGIQSSERTAGTGEEEQEQE